MQDELADPRSFVTGTFHQDDNRLKVPEQTFDVKNKKKGRYVKFTCDTNWAGTCALHSIAIIEAEDRFDDDVVTMW